jgi:hypothetical protein
MEYLLNYHEGMYVIYLKFDTNNQLSTKLYGGFVHYLTFNWLFSPWYNWKKAELAFNNNHVLTTYTMHITNDFVILSDFYYFHEEMNNHLKCM